VILLQNICKQYGSKVLYNDVSMTLHPGKRYGLIGHNGAGKSVLLKIIAGEELPDDGTISISSNCSVAYLTQEAETDIDMTPMEIVLEPFKHLLEADAVFAELAAIEDHESLEYEKAADKVHSLQQEMEKHDVYSLRSRASTILAGLGVAQENWDLPSKELSGGFRMRVVLTQLLIQEPDFLFMDEPTNHLDLDSLIWLERFLLKFSGGLLIVSHDRDFMNRVVTHTLEINRQKIVDHTGNLDAFFAWKAEKEEHEAKREKNITDKIEKAERFVERFKSKATKASQARSRMKYVDKLKEEITVDSGVARKALAFSLPPATPCGSTPIKLDNITAGYDDLVVLDNVSLSVNKGNKVAVIGPNGAGKSTLMKVIAERLEVMKGKIVPGHNAEIRYFSQHRLDDLDDSKTLYDTVADHLGENRPQEVQRLLGTFLFSGDEVMKKIGVLSGGEKSRISLLMMLVHPGNTLLLDEPTNHLDIDSIATVADALAAYDGTVVVISHDEYFISKIADRIIEVRPGIVHDFPGTLKDYRYYCEQGLIGKQSSDTPTSEAVEQSPEQVTKQERIANREKRKKLTRQSEKMEREIAVLEEKIEEKEEILNDESNAQNVELLVDTQKEITGINNDLEKLMEQWEEIQMEIEE